MGSIIDSKLIPLSIVLGWAGIAIFGCGSNVGTSFVLASSSLISFKIGDLELEVVVSFSLEVLIGDDDDVLGVLFWFFTFFL